MSQSTHQAPISQSRIAAVAQLGQQVWLDTLSRQLIESGTLANWINNDAVAGLTSNPAIFHQALSKDSAYQPAITAARATENNPEVRFENVVLPDIQAACDLFLPLWQQTSGEQGYVSFEVSPTLAHDTAGTTAADVFTTAATGSTGAATAGAAGAGEATAGAGAAVCADTGAVHWRRA